MRTRTRSLPQQRHVVDYWVATNPVPGDGSFSEALTFISPNYNDSGGTETIIDDATPVQREKYVKHTRSSVMHYPLQRTLSGRYNTSNGLPANQQYLWNSSSHHAYFVERSAKWRALSAWGPSQFPKLADVPGSVQIDAFEQLMPKLNDGLSIINFLLELKDLRRMFDSKTVSRLMRNAYNGLDFTVPTWRDLALRRRSTKRKSKTREVVADSADDFLNYSFGWKPFLSDLGKMYKALCNLSNKMDYLERNQGKPIIRHYSTELEVPELAARSTIFETHSGLTLKNFVYWSTFGMTPNKAHVLRSNAYDYRPRYHATIEYMYTLPKAVGVWAKHRRALEGFLGIAGVQLNPGVLWNALPFSFVVDWITDVGTFLRQFTPRDLGIEVVIIDASHSVKYSQVSMFTASVPIYSGTPNTKPGRYDLLPICDEQIAYYERAPWNPGLFMVGVKSPELMHWALGGALAISQNKRRFKNG